LNALKEKYGDALVVVATPCNQFGHQCPEKDFELLATFKHVRPGNGFEPKFTLTTKMTVNGAEEHPFWTFLKQSAPAPSDDKGGLGSDHIYNIQPNTNPIQWTPVRRSDVSWNFEKFLIGKDGKVVKRYSPKFENANIAADIDALLRA